MDLFEEANRVINWRLFWDKVRRHERGEPRELNEDEKKRLSELERIAREVKS